MGVSPRQPPGPFSQVAVSCREDSPFPLPVLSDPPHLVKLPGILKGLWQQKRLRWSTVEVEEG